MSDCSTPGGDRREAYQHAKDSSSPNLESGDFALWEGHTLKVQPRAQSASRGCTHARVLALLISCQLSGRERLFTSVSSSVAGAHNLLQDMRARSAC